MRCKAGDLAVIVNALTEHQHIGKIVRCVKPYDFDAWECEPELLHECGRPIAWVDDHLRPIRDNDGEDETLQWAPVPTKETA